MSEGTFGDPTAPGWRPPDEPSHDRSAEADEQVGDVTGESSGSPATQEIGTPPTEAVPLPPPGPFAPLPTPGQQPAPPQPYGATPSPHPYGPPPPLGPPPPVGPPTAYGQDLPSQAAVQAAHTSSASNPYAHNPYARTPGPVPPGAPSQAPPPGSYRPAPPGANASAIVLCVLSVVSLLPTCLCSVPALIISIIALSKNSDDPAGSRRLTKWGWGAWAAGIVIAVAVWVMIAIFGNLSGSIDDGYSY